MTAPDSTSLDFPSPDFRLLDQSGTPVSLSDHLDAGVFLLFLRGDW